MQSEKCKIAVQNAKFDIRQRAYRFAVDLVKFIDSLSSDQTSKILSNQLLRSGTSIGANIIEAQAASSRRDFRNFINHALKSANEAKFWLGLLMDAGKVSREKGQYLLREATELANILAKSILTLKER